jgi:predicted secreted protein
MKLEEYKQPIEVLLQTKVGESLVDLNGERANVRSQETNLGNLVADAMVSQTVSFGTTVAIVNSGAIRASIPAGDISLGQIREVMPYDNYLVVLALTGRQIIAALENGVSQVADGAGRFPQVSGLRYIWNPEAAAGSRIVSVEVKSDGGYKPIDLTGVYRVVTSDFLARGGDGYTVFQEAISVDSTGFVDYETLRDYIQNNSPLHPGVEGRIIQIMGISGNIDESFNGQAIDVKAGDTFQIKLESNATTGYSWQLAGISDSSVADIIGSVYIGPETLEGEMPLARAPGTELWSFQALKAGICKITLEYRRPWESAEAPARQFALTVVVK